MKTIYQIGKHRLHIHDESLTHEIPYESRYKSTELLRSPYFMTQTGRWMFKEMSLKISGTLVDVKDFATAEQVAQVLRSEIDVINDVIAYEIYSSKVPGQCACQLGNDDLIWLHNLGIIRSVDVVKTDAFEPAELRLEMEFLSFWEPLNLLIWYWGFTPEIPLDPADQSGPYRNLVSITPTANQVFNPRNRQLSMWVRRNFIDYKFLYDPLSWEICRKPEFSVSRTWVPGGWYTADFSKYDWGAPPHVMYAFTKLLTTGDITIRVLREQGWSRTEETLTLSLDQLDSDLSDAGYSGLLPRDQVLLGDVTRLPGYVRRDGELLNISPLVSYSSYWPGMLYPGQNRFFIDPAGGMTAFQIVPRKL